MPVPDSARSRQPDRRHAGQPGTVLPDGYRADGRRWPQSLAGGAAGIALLHVERARTGHGDWATARTWLAEAASGNVTAASNARLFFGAPALAFVFHIAASVHRPLPQCAGRAGRRHRHVTRTALAAAHARIDRGERPELREFDLIRGLAGLGAYHLAAHPGHEITRDVLTCLVRLTEPLPGTGDGLPPWWTDASPSGEPSPDFPGGHGNFGMSHGISAVLAVLSLAILRGVTVPGAHDAAHRICAWTDQWRHGDQAGPWWPGVITATQAEAGSVDPALRPRPSWCYGVAGTARAQQLAGLALRDPARRARRRGRDPRRPPRPCGARPARPSPACATAPPGSCKPPGGWPPTPPPARSSTSSPVSPPAWPPSSPSREDDNPELLDGTAGAALALHTVGTGNAPEPCWDAFLALA